MNYFYAKSMADTNTFFLIGCRDDEGIIHTFTELFSEYYYSHIRALSCFKHLLLSTVEGADYAEYCIEPSTIDNLIYVDLEAENWSEEDKTLILAWLNRQPVNIDTLPVCYRIAGDSILATQYKQKLLMVADLAVFTQDIENSHTVITGFKSGRQVFGAYKIFTDPSVYKNLCTILGTTCDGYYTFAYDTKPFAYAILPKALDSNLNVLFMHMDSCTDASVRAVLYNDMQRLTQGIDCSSTTSLHFSTFDNVVGRPEAYSMLCDAAETKIFVKHTDETISIFAACIQGTWISLSDIVHLQHTYDVISEALGAENIIRDRFSRGANGPAVTLEIINENAVNAKIEDFELIPADIKSSLEVAYKQITEDGFIFADISSDIENPVVKDLLFAKLGVSTGDLQAAKEYSSMYQVYNPTMESAVQLKPTAAFSRALPTYDQLVQVYNQNKDDTELDTAEDTAETTDYFNDSESIQSLTSLSTYDDLDMHIDSEAIQVGSIFKYYDCVHLREAVKATKTQLDLKLIEGDSANNTLGICENELTFFLAVRNLIIFGICVEKDIYTLAGVKEALQNGITSQIVSDFLKDIAHDAYNLNWAHTGHVYANEMTESSDDDSDETSATPGVKFLGYYTVEVTTKDGALVETVKPDSIDLFKTQAGAGGMETNLDNPVDGWPRVRAYVEQHTLNSFAWLEVAIRLLRWGARKPDSLFVPSVDSKIQKMYLNLQTLVISDFSGNFDLCSPDTYTTSVGDTNYTLGLAVYTEINDTELVNTIASKYDIQLTAETRIPCGLALFTTFEDSALTRQTFIDVFTAAALISAGSLAILGITFDHATQKFSCNTDELSIFANERRDGAYTRCQVHYLAEEHFSLEEGMCYSVNEVLDRNVSSPQAYTIYTCKFLLRPIQLLSVFFDGMNTKNISVFNLIKKFQLKYDSSTYEACTDLLKLNTSNKSEIESFKNNLRQDMNLQSTDIYSNILFTEYVLPLYATLASRVTSNCSVAELLTQALAVLRELDERHSKASQVTSAIGFNDVISDCEQYFRYCHPRTKEVLFYGAKPKIHGKFVLWAPEDNISVGVQFTDKTVIDMYSTCIGPAEFTGIWKPALSKGATPQMKARYEAMLKKYFILPKLDTYTRAIMTCVRVNKELKA